MIPDVTFDTSTSMLKFQKVSDLRRHLKRLLDLNLREMDKLSDITSMMMRDGENEEGGQTVKGWVKRGPVFINKTDPDRATLDVMFALAREIKPKIAQIEGALRTADDLESMGIEEHNAVLVYTKMGLPERFIVISTDAPAKDDRYEMKATYLTV